MIYGLAAGFALIVIGILKDDFFLYIPIVIALLAAVIIRYRNQIRTAVPNMNWSLIRDLRTWIETNKKWLVTTVMVLSLTILYANIFPLGMDFGLTFKLIVAIIAAVFVVIFFDIKGKIAQRTLYGSTIIIILLYIASIATGSFDPGDLLPDIEKNWKIHQIERGLEESDRRDDVSRLDKILTSIKKDENPSYADMKYFNEVKGSGSFSSLKEKLSKISFSIPFRTKPNRKSAVKEYSFTPRWEGEPGNSGEKVRPGEKFLGIFSPGTYSFTATGGADTHWIKSGGKKTIVSAKGIKHYESVMADCYFPDRKYGEMIIRVGENRYLFLGEEITITEKTKLYAFSNKRKNDPKDYIIFGSNIKIKIKKKRRS